MRALYHISFQKSIKKFGLYVTKNVKKLEIALAENYKFFFDFRWAWKY